MKELHSVLMQIPFAKHSQWFADVLGKHVEVAQDNLGPERASAAQSRGKGLDMWQVADELLGFLSV